MNIYQSIPIIAGSLRLKLALFQQQAKGSRETATEGPVVLYTHFNLSSIFK